MASSSASWSAHGRVGRARVVEAVDGDQALEGVGVRAVLAALDVVVVEEGEQLAVAVLRRRPAPRPGRARPSGRRAPRRWRCTRCPGRSRGPGTSRGLASSLASRASRAAPGLPSLWNGQVGPGRAVGQERVERALQADDLAAGLVDVVAVRVDGAVDHHRPHGLREHRGVRGAELAAVGEAEVADLVLAERLADLVHVAGRVLRGDVGEDPAAAGLARRRSPSPRR